MLLPTQVVVALRGIELHGEAAHVAHRVGRTRTARHRREPREDRRRGLWILKKRRARVLGHGLVYAERAMGRRTSGVHDALGDALVIEVRDLLAQDEVLQQRRSARRRLEAVLVVGNGDALVRGERLVTLHELRHARIGFDESRRGGRRLLASGHAALRESGVVVWRLDVVWGRYFGTVVPVPGTSWRPCVPPSGKAGCCPSDRCVCLACIRHARCPDTSGTADAGRPSSAGNPSRAAREQDPRRRQEES